MFNFYVVETIGFAVINNLCVLNILNEDVEITLSMAELDNLLKLLLQKPSFAQKAKCL